jgi:hypothetical protein
MLQLLSPQAPMSIQGVLMSTLNVLHTPLTHKLKVTYIV